MKSVKSRLIDKRKEGVIDFYRLIDTINVNQIRFTEFYRFIDWRIDTDFYRLTTSGTKHDKCYN